MREGRARAIRGSRSRAAAQPYFVALAVGVVGLDRDLAVERPRQPVESVAAVALEVAGEVRVDAHDYLADVGVLGRPHLRRDGAEDLGGQGRVGLRHAAAFAGRAYRGEQRAEVLAHALARHLDQAELGDLEHVRPGLVVGQRALQSSVDLLAVVRRFHVDEVDDDDTAQIAQPDLPDDLDARFQVDLEYGLLEVPLTDVLAGVHVDRHERLGVVDDDVPAGLEPDPAAERALDVLLDAERLENRSGLRPVPHPVTERRHQGFDIAGAPLVYLARVNDELVDLRREEIAHDAEGQIAFLV